MADKSMITPDELKNVTGGWDKSMLTSEKLAKLEYLTDKFYRERDRGNPMPAYQELKAYTEELKKKYG